MKEKYRENSWQFIPKHACWNCKKLEVCANVMPCG
jgi:hypothetical protein